VLKQQSRSITACAIAIIFLAVTPVPASASITDSYGCSEFARMNGWEGGMQGYLDYPLGVARGEVRTFGHYSSSCQSIGGAVVEVLSFQFRWSGGEFVACDAGGGGYATGYMNAYTECTPGGSEGDLIGGFHSVWVEGNELNAVPNGELEGHI
jgi:hypothetical protein